MLAEKKLFLFDIDGTVAVDNDLLDGSRELFSYIDAIGGMPIFITNNSTRGICDYVQKFRRWGLSYTERNFVTAGYAACLYLKQRHVSGKIFVVGTRSFIQELKSHGLPVTGTIQPGIRCVLVGFDNELTYQKIADACELLETKAVAYVATNPDLCCPTAFGSVPDCGAICRMIECAAGKKPHFVGKPDPFIVRLCLERSGFSAEQALVVGDRLYTDIACGINSGIQTAVVFTGEAKKTDLAETPFRPTFAFPSVKELYREIIREREKLSAVQE